MKVVWPNGYSARPGPPVEIRDETGRVVARVGDQVALPGGALADDEWWVCPAPLPVATPS